MGYRAAQEAWMGDMRRKNERVNALVPVRLEDGAVGLTRDMSPSGIYFTIAEGLTPGQIIRFSSAQHDASGMRGPRRACRSSRGQVWCRGRDHLITAGWSGQKRQESKRLIARFRAIVTAMPSTVNGTGFFQHPRLDGRSPKFFPRIARKCITEGGCLIARSH